MTSRCCETELVQVYTATLATDLHPWSAFLSFISQLAQLSKNTFPIAIHAQLLEILIWVSGRQKRGLTQDTRVEAYCNVAFAILSTCPTNEQDDLLAEQMSRYCSDPDERPTSLAQLIQYLTLQEQWLAVERRLLEKHVHAMLNNLGSWPTSDLGDIFRGSQTGYVDSIHATYLCRAHSYVACTESRVLPMLLLLFPRYAISYGVLGSAGMCRGKQRIISQSCRTRGWCSSWTGFSGI